MQGAQHMARVSGCAEKTVGTLFPIPLKTNLLLSFSYPIEDKPTIVFSSPVVDNYKNIIPALKPKTILSFEEKLFGVSSTPPPVNIRKHKMVFEDNRRPPLVTVAEFKITISFGGLATVQVRLVNNH